ncbi:MAG: DEAD/DEAH box helicase [Candidatus Omnitrophota bacterium]
MDGLDNSLNLSFVSDRLVKVNYVRGTLELGIPKMNDHFLGTLKKKIQLKYDARVGVWRCDAMHYSLIRHLVKEMGDRVEDNVFQERRVRWDHPTLPPLRKEQIEALDAWMTTKQGVIVMPTGTGKTNVALSIMKELGVSTLVVSPVRDLMYQWHRRILDELGYDAGIIGDNIFNIQPVSVTTYDSAYIHMETLGDTFQFIIFDECHHLPGKQRREAALMSAAPLRLGLTATPERADGRHTDLGLLIGPIVYDLPIASVRGETIADYDIVRIPIHLSEEEQTRYNEASRCIRDYFVKRKREDQSFDWLDAMAEIGKDPEARAAQKAWYIKQSIQDRAEEKFRVLEDIFRIHAGERVLVFCGSNVMAREISARFLVPCLLNHCGKRERMEILDGFKNNVYPVLVANKVLDEGVDIPEARIAVIVGGGASSRQAKQRLGRILRKKENKRGILYEVVCEETTEVARSQNRRRSDAYKRALHRSI